MFEVIEIWRRRCEGFRGFLQQALAQGEVWRGSVNHHGAEGKALDVRDMSHQTHDRSVVDFRTTNYVQTGQSGNLR